MSKWQPIETAPRDGTWLLAYGDGYKALAERGVWVTHDEREPRIKHVMLIKWIEAWYDKEVDLGNGTYRKERTQGYAYWWPEPHGFHPTHWQSLPLPPVDDGAEVVK